MIPEEPIEHGAATDRALGSVGQGVALSLVTAALGLAAFPPFSIGPLIFVALVPVLVAQHRVLPAGWAGLGPGVAITAFSLAYGWNVIPENEGASALRFGFILLGVAVFVLGTIERRIHEATGYRWFLLLAPLAWVAADFLRGGLPQISTWGYPAYALFESPVLLQLVSLTGILGLNLLILLVNWGVAAWLLGRLGDPRFRRRRLRLGVVAVAGGFAAWTVSGFLMIGAPDATVTVAAVQPGPQARFGPVSSEGGGLLPAAYLGATMEAARAGARLVVWPEYGLPFDPRRRAAGELFDLSAQTDAYIVVGYGEWGPEGNRNEAVVVTPDGRFLGPYAKQHPVTVLGEESTTRYGYPVHDTEIGRLATIICYDLDFTDTARHVSRRGAEIVAVPSQDWGSIAHKHYPLLVLRAVENHVTMVKADLGYDSAIIDPYGRIVERRVTPEGASALLVADVPLGSGPTVAARLGDWPGRVLVVLAAAAISRALIALRRRRNEDSVATGSSP